MFVIKALDHGKNIVVAITALWIRLWRIPKESLLLLFAEKRFLYLLHELNPDQK